MAESSLINTTRLQIVPFYEKYLTQRYVHWLNDPEVVKYSEQRHRTHTLETCHRYWQAFIDTPHFFWAIVVSQPPLGHIGNMNAHIDPKNLLADIGILIGERESWRKGYGLEAWMAVCDYLFNETQIRKITAGALATNEGMLKIMQRSGMLEDGRRFRHYLLDGQEVDVVYAALFKQKF